MSLEEHNQGVREYVLVCEVGKRTVMPKVLQVRLGQTR